jgi:hypothetical protein
MRKQTYCHPSQGSPARAYFEDLQADDARCWRRARRAGAAAVLMFVSGVEVVSSHGLTGFALTASGVMLIGEAMGQVCQTDSNYHQRQKFLELANQHYRTHQEPAPEWLELHLSCPAEQPAE